MDLFEYPVNIHVRRHGPSGYRSYESYKPWLRDEFTFQCVYCLCRERWFPDGEAAFSVDHLYPRVSAPERYADYDNLLYACCQCNAVRGASSVPDPGELAYGQVLRVMENGLVEALTPHGQELIDICRLNRPHLVTFRRGMLEVLTTLRQRKRKGLADLLRHYLGTPRCAMPIQAQADLPKEPSVLLNWDPYCTLSGWFGVTSLTIGQCVFGFAPTKPEDRDLNMRMMNRIEAIPLESMRQGMRWDWVTFPEYLDSLDKQGLGVNVGSLIPFSPLRGFVQMVHGKLPAETVSSS